MKKINVVVVDDSALVRQVLTEIIKSDMELNLLYTASDPIFAFDKMKSQWPDVIILDVEMPRMDGITFLKKIMAEKPTPIIICSTLTIENSETTMQALSSGAVEIITKPQVGLKNFLTDSANRLLDAVKAASRSNLSQVAKISSANASRSKPLSEDILKIKASSSLSPLTTTDKIVAIGTSTGGTIALEFILTKLEPNCPGIVIVQHMPEKFTKAFADRLNSISKIEIKEAQSGDRVTPGRALIAPGNFHMALKRSGAQYFVDIQDGPLVSRHRPSVDVLFRSVAKNAGRNALGIIMTGMGDDGASGMKDMHDNGIFTYAQNEESCVVFGMPKEAIKRGGVDRVVDLNEIPNIVQNYITA
ncbi:MAG: chemotaxis response regulator protein-glutamate methylesterase [Leptospiraceae bacterium]|nr:chemotaxis response regulator protein-glutamate methylesterase [Leptospiraceae bacterium]MCP5512093.1 chemotaxis response regulator protein-glutamate methylesterase [Leptospiraceae bacterium]